MSHGFLPISKEDMKEAGIEQLDFVYICGDAYVDHPDMPSSHGFWRHMAIKSGSLRSRTGRTALPLTG